MKSLLRTPPAVSAEITTAPLALLVTTSRVPAWHRSTARGRIISFTRPPRGNQPRWRLPRRTRRPSWWMETAPDGAYDEVGNSRNNNFDTNNNEADLVEDNLPMSLAALSKLHSSRLQHQHRTPGTGLKPTSPAPVSRRAPPAAPDSLASATFTGVAAAATAAAAPLQPDLQNPASRCQVDPVVNPDSRNSAPLEPSHPPVTFRTVAELRRMLQERQMVAGQTVALLPPTTAATAEALPVAYTGPGGGGGFAAAVSPPSPPPLPPRRFFGGNPLPLPHAATGPRPVPTHETAVAEHFVGTGGCSNDASSSSGNGTSSVPLSIEALGSVSAAPAAAALAGPAARGVASPPPRPVSATGRAPGGLVPGIAISRSDISGIRGSGAGHVVDPELEDDREYQKAKRYALSLLQRSPLSAYTLTRRLLARGYPAHLTSQLQGWLQEEGALNDRRYAKMYAASKWNANRTAPAKIKLELTAQGVGAADVAAALVYVFGPSRRIRLTGLTTTPEELEVREALLDAARRHVGQHQHHHRTQHHHQNHQEPPPPPQRQQDQHQGVTVVESLSGGRYTAAAAAVASSSSAITAGTAFGTSNCHRNSSSPSPSPASDGVEDNIDITGQHHSSGNRGNNSSSSSSSTSSSRSGSSSSSGTRWVGRGQAAGDQAGRGADEWKARVKEQNTQRRRLASWLQYRGHEMDVVLKVFELLGV